MAGLLSFSMAGLGFLIIAAIEALLPFSSRSSLPSLRSLHSLSVLLLSSLFILHSLVSSFFSSPKSDPIGYPLPLSSISAASLFLLHSLSSLLLPPLFSPLLPLLSLFAFLQEFLFLYLTPESSPSSLESRYFSLLLVPVLACLISTLLSLARPLSPFPRLARAVALALHGTWLIQIGFSLFSSAIAHGCSLRSRSWANYTVDCKAHMDAHRAAAIATLQFNCHLALILVLTLGIYSLAVNSGAVTGGPARYRPLSKELERFSLGSDEDDMVEGKQEEVALSVVETRNGDSH